MTSLRAATGTALTAFVLTVVPRAQEPKPLDVARIVVVCNDGDGKPVEGAIVLLAAV